MTQVKLLLVSVLALWSISSVASSKIVNCYIGTWAYYRTGDGKFDTSHIDPKLCTHLSYSFFGITDGTGEVKHLDSWLDLQIEGSGYIKKIMALKKVNPKLKVILVVGGWNEGSARYSQMAAVPKKRKAFIDSALKLIKQHGFDGLDLDWEYPAKRDGAPKDKQNFVVLLKEIYEALKPLNLDFGIAVGASAETASTSYDIPNISKYVDFINVMTYDFATHGEGVLGYNAPLRGQGEKNVESSIKNWLKQGAPASKLVLGLPFYGRTFKLSSPQQFTLGSGTVGGGEPGPFTKEVGYMGYNEICAIKNSWTEKWADKESVPFLHKGDTIISYDNAKSLELKVDLSKSLGLAGVMIWSIETEDFLGKCGNGKHPLLKAINAKLGN